MTRKELQANQEYMWRALLGEQRMALTLAVEMLSRCHLSPQQILSKTMRALEFPHSVISMACFSQLQMLDKPICRH
jgi:hypothetical protein